MSNIETEIESNDNDFISVTAKVIKFCIASFIYVTLFFYYIIDLGMIWDDPRGGTSNSKAPILTNSERWERSIPTIILIIITSFFLFRRIYKTLKKQKT